MVAMEEKVTSLTANFDQFVQSANEYALLAQMSLHNHTHSLNWLQNSIPAALGALAGALASFLFMQRAERKKNKEHENNTINHAIQIALLNIQSLCNYKHTYLYDFEGFFDKLEGHVSQYGPNIPDDAREKLAKEWYTTFAPEFLKLQEQYKDEVIRSDWNGLLREFQDGPPLYEFDIERLYFISSNEKESPNLIALLSQANHKFQSLKNLKVIRQEVFNSDHHLAPYIVQFSSGTSKDNDPKFEDVMIALFKFLNIRSTIRHQVDICLIAQQASYLLLKQHQKKNYDPTIKSARKNKIKFWWNKFTLKPMYVHISGGSFNTDQMPSLPECSNHLTNFIGASISCEEYEYISKHWSALSSSPEK